MEKKPNTKCLVVETPCIMDDSLILTKEGYKQLKDIKVGDMVLTKSNTWHPVVKIFDNGIADTRYLSGAGFFNIHCINEHKFYVRKRIHKADDVDKRKLTEPAFERADKLSRSHYMGIPVIQEEKPFYSNSSTFWFLIGKMFMQGYVNDDVDEGIVKFFKETFGDCAINRNIPMSVITLPNKLLRSFLIGLVSKNWYEELKDNKLYHIEPITEQSAYAISLIINKLFHLHANIKRTYVSNHELPRSVDRYCVNFTVNNVTKWKSFYEDGYIWLNIENIRKAEQEHVYNIEVEDAHSYVACGVISKNC